MALVFPYKFDKPDKESDAPPYLSEAFYDENCGSSAENTVLRAL